jgi:hypothetical protein
VNSVKLSKTKIDREMKRIAREISKQFYLRGRDHEWERISTLAGLTADGDILPPGDNTEPSRAGKR